MIGTSSTAAVATIGIQAADTAAIEAKERELEQMRMEGEQEEVAE